MSAPTPRHSRDGRDSPRTFRQRTRSDSSGFTLVELIVAMAISMIVMSVIPSLFETVTTATANTQGISTASEQAGLAIQSLDVQVSSASQVCLPTQLTATQTVTEGWALRVEQLEASGPQQWEQWVVDPTTGLMQEETFTPGGAGGGWTTVAKTIYNSTSIPPFTEPLAATGSPQEVLIDLEVSEKPGRLTQKLEIKSAVSAFSTPHTAVPAPTPCDAATTPPTS
ncbi:MAG: PilW family protein [Acidimicrobiales bacterium]